MLRRWELQQTHWIFRPLTSATKNQFQSGCAYNLFHREGISAMNNGQSDKGIVSIKPKAQ